MNKIIISFKTMLLAVILLTGSVNAFGATITITQSTSGITSNSYDSGAERVWTQSTVGFGSKAVLKQTTPAALQLQSGNGVVYNTTEMPGNITSIKVTQTGTARACAISGYTARLVNATTADYTVNTSSTSMGSTSGSPSTITFTGSFKYFAIKVPSSATYISEIVITYDEPTSSCTPLVAPTVTPTAGNAQAILSWGAVANASSYTLIWNGGAPETVTSPVTKTGLTNGTSYSYSVMAVGDGTTYCATNPTATGNVTPTAPAVGEPTNHASTFTAVANSSTQITLTWTDATGAIAPAGYLVKASTTTPTAPADGTPEVDATLVKNIAQGTQTAVFTGLSASTAYNFAIWPYSNSGAAIDYKTGSQPTANATTETPLGVPVATAASGISSTGFTANWDAAASATSYDVNVYTKSAGTVAADLFISEYIEGSSSNKYIEIYNGTGAAVDLSNYKLQLFSNGATTATGANDVALSGTLANGATVVYKNSSATLTLPNGVTATNNTAVNFNGDDAIALYKISSASYVDIFGKIGEDPGASWGTTPLITADKTLVRKSTITGGVTTNPASGFTTLVSDWDSYIIDEVSYLGSHTISGAASSTPISGSPFTVSGTTSKELTGLTPETTYYYTVVAKKGAESSVASNEISATTSVSTALNNGKAGTPFITTAKGKLTVNQLAANSTVRVYDATGRMLATKVSTNGSVQIPLQVAGVYTVRIAAGAKNWTLKVVNSNL